MSFFPQRSEQHINQVVQVSKSIVANIVLKHVKKTLNPDDKITGSEIRNEMQDIRREKSAYADPFYRPQPKPAETSTQIIPAKILDLDTDPLEQD